MCRGYHRRQAEKWRRTREGVTALYNVNRDAQKHPEPFAPHEIMWLPGDPVPEPTTPETPEAIEDLWAELDARDAEIL